MDMPLDAAQVSYILSSFASTGKIIESGLALIKMGIRPKYDDLKKEADKEVTDHPNNTSDLKKTEVLAAHIPKVMVEALEKAVEAINASIAKSMGDLNMPLPEMETRINNDQRNLCARISKISEHGPLPGSLQSAWEKNKCAEKGFELG